MQIFIEATQLRAINNNKKWIAINYLEPENTIYNIKQILSNKFNIPIKTFYFVFGGRILDNKLTLKYYNIESESSLIFCPRIGAVLNM